VTGGPRDIPAELRGRPLDEVVRRLYEVSWGQARGWIETGKIWIDGKAVRDTRAPVAGASLELKMNAPRKAASDLPASAFGRARMVHVDSQIVVVDKPPGMSTVPFDERESGTLIDRVCLELGARKLEVVHRIDKETSGLLVFARTVDAAHKLAQQFRAHDVHRRYVALARGRVEEGTIRSVLLKDRGDGLRGSARPGFRVAPGEGKEATTHVRVVEELNAATWIECRLETGRTHQIRIHLAESGHPLLGERVYGPTGARDDVPRLMLHATELGFVHPSTGARVSWKLEPPEDFRKAVERLRS
jgi:23S rRNA pseudouridine1911/1915/1917 synthase